MRQAGFVSTYRVLMPTIDAFRQYLEGFRRSERVVYPYQSIQPSGCNRMPKVKTYETRSSMPLPISIDLFASCVIRLRNWLFPMRRHGDPMVEKTMSTHSGLARIGVFNASFSRPFNPPFFAPPLRRGSRSGSGECDQQARRQTTRTLHSKFISLTYLQPEQNR